MPFLQSDKSTGSKEVFIQFTDQILITFSDPDKFPGFGEFKNPYLKSFPEPVDPVLIKFCKDPRNNYGKDIQKNIPAIRKKLVKYYSLQGLGKGKG